MKLLEDLDVALALSPGLAVLKGMAVGELGLGFGMDLGLAVGVPETCTHTVVPHPYL